MQRHSEWAAPAGYVVSADPVRLDVDVDRIHRFLSTSYSSTGIPRDLVQGAIAKLKVLASSSAAAVAGAAKAAGARIRAASESKTNSRRRGARR